MKAPRAWPSFLKQLDRWFDSTHYLVDEDGRDVLTGEDRSYMVPLPVKRSAFRQNMQRLTTYLTGAERTGVAGTDDGRYRMLARSKPWQSVHPQLPYFIGVLVIMSIIYFLVAMRIASSLKAIATAAERFGQGDWNARVARVGPSGEIANLGRTFNHMAERISALLVSERRLLQDVSHELRSPLARLAFAAELTRTASDRDAAVDEIEEHLTCLTDLVSSLLQVTRDEGDPSSRKSEDVALGDVLTDVAATCTLQAEARTCHLRVQGFASHAVVGDRRLLARAVDNVVRNAIHFAPADSQVAVTLRDDNAGWVIVEVQDRGPGVPETMLSRIFEPFCRVDDSRQTATGGVGLGLSIVQRIVQQHSGWVRASNCNPGLLVTMAFPAGVRLQSTPVEMPRPAA